MGNSSSLAASGRGDRRRRSPPSAESSRVLFLLYLIHRTWSVVVEHVDAKSARWRGSHTAASSAAAGVGRLDSVSLCESSAGSCCSECTYCNLRDCSTHDTLSEVTLQAGPMAHPPAPWQEEPVHKDKQRPPIYNPEDYAAALRKWGRKACAGALYDADAGPRPARAATLPPALPPAPGKDFRNPGLGAGAGAGAGAGEEMSLRQFSSPSELLAKLRADLRLSFPSFVQEFASEPLDGVPLLLDLLRNVQLSQGDARGPPTPRRRPLLDELACLQCLWSCTSRYSECVRRLVAAGGGVYTLTSCIMSSVNKARVLALQLLTLACETCGGHSLVSEALSTLRLRYGEPVRFRFLAGMLASAGGGSLQAAGLAFVTALLASAPTPQARLYLQAELHQAGLRVEDLRQMLSRLPAPELLRRQVESYESQLIDVESLSERARDQDELRRKLQLLENKVQTLQEEKGMLLSLEKCLKEKCCELQQEVSSLRSEHGSARKKTNAHKKKLPAHAHRDESSPPEDEGISSSERSLSPEPDAQREPRLYEVCHVQHDTYDLMRGRRTFHKTENRSGDNKSSDEEEETTIDEVIQELRNIVNHAESEQHSADRARHVDDEPARCHRARDDRGPDETTPCHKHADADKEDSITSTRHSIRISDSTEFLSENNKDLETEIVPTNLVPHPPRKAKSLIRLFASPAERGLLYNKPADLYDDAFYSSDEGSDSLLSASRYRDAAPGEHPGPGFDFRERRAPFAGAERAPSRPRARTRSREEQRRTAVRRSESFQTSEKGSRQREYIDSMFYSDARPGKPAATASPLRRSSSKGSRVDEIVSLIESKKLTKSLDRIDEGLNSMVDIVMLSEPEKPSWPYERRQRPSSRPVSRPGSCTASDAGRAAPSARLPRTVQRDFEDLTTSDSQKFYLPHPKLSTGSFDNSYTGTSFIVKRGHSNAGFYSGAHLLRDAPAGLTSLVVSGSPGHLHGHNDLERTLSPMSSTGYGLHKLTDSPSGLY